MQPVPSQEQVTDVPLGAPVEIQPLLILEVNKVILLLITNEL